MSAGIGKSITAYHQDHSQVSGPVDIDFLSGISLRVFPPRSSALCLLADSAPVYFKCVF